MHKSVRNQVCTNGLLSEFAVIVVHSQWPHSEALQRIFDYLMGENAARKKISMGPMYVIYDLVFAKIWILICVFWCYF